MIFKLFFKRSIKEIKALGKNEELETIANKFPSDVEIAQEILDMTGASCRPIIEQSETAKTSLYIVITNKILIANMKNSYARIQTIAHECIHSAQNKGLLFLNFIISNITMLYFILITALTLFRVIEMNIWLIILLVVMVLIQLSTRLYLEVDAMIKARRLASEYMNMKDVSKEEVEKLLQGYDTLNKIGIPLIIARYTIGAVATILIYILVGI